MSKEMDAQLLRCEIEALVSEREGMLIANELSKENNDPIAYGENAFLNLSSAFQGLRHSWS